MGVRVTDEHDRSIEDRLRDLKTLHDEGLITDAEYAEKRQQIIDQIGDPPPVAAPPPPVIAPPSVAPAPPTVVVKQSSGCLKAFLILVVVGLIGIWALASLGSNIADTTSLTFANIAQDLPGQSSGRPLVTTTTRCGGSVTYRLQGTARTVDITMRNAQGNTEQLSNVALPWTKPLRNVDCGEFLYLSAQNQGTFGSVKCSISLNGTVIEEAESSGRYVIATCSGSAR